MTIQANKTGVRTSINIRIKPEERNLIDQAAKALGKNRTDFVLDAARHAAEDALMECTVLKVSPETYNQWLALLDAPPQPNERLRRALQTSVSWD